MPIYEYECAKGHVFELMVSISGPDPKTCAIAGCRSKPKRLLSASGFILKGDGWYATDYPSEARKQGLDQESKAANPGTGADSGHTCNTGCGHGATPDSATPESAPPAAAKPEPAKTPKTKNPYSSGRHKSKSPAKGKS